MTTGVRSFVRAFPRSGIAFVGTTDLADNTLSVATRANEHRQVVTEFVDIVRAVLASLAGLAPGISPIPSTGPRHHGDVCETTPGHPRWLG